ncbi:MAG: S53 family peptidase [Acidimicrobiales bacterium]
MTRGGDRIDQIELPGSERRFGPEEVEVGAADPAGRVEVSVVLAPRSGAPVPDPAGGAAVLSRSELAGVRGAEPAHVDAIIAFAAESGLEVVEADPVRRRVVVAGTAAVVASAFGVRLARFRTPDGEYRGQVGPVRLPAGLGGVVVAVLGLDERPQARSQLRPGSATTAGYTPVQVGQAYGLPPGVDGAGQTIGIVELGGGYRQSDLDAYFAGLGLPVPTVTAVPVDGGANRPTGGTAGPDTEVALDIEVAGAVAPGAAMAVYFAPNTDRGFLDAVTAAVHDTTNSPSVVSISWGGPESTWTAQAMTAFDQALADAALAGVTVTVAAGDHGSSDGTAGGRAEVDFPASSPHALACGGTSLQTAGGSIASEAVWNDGPGRGATGGGISATFLLPPWQQGAGVPPSVDPGHHVGRGLPDVAGDADPATGYRIRVDGTDMVVGGTSAVAPLWAALVALLGQTLGRQVGWLNPTLYTVAGVHHALRDITVGDNGAYRAGPGWDACTGWGSPDGPALASALAPAR